MFVVVFDIIGMSAVIFVFLFSKVCASLPLSVIHAFDVAIDVSICDAESGIVCDTASTGTGTCTVIVSIRSVSMYRIVSVFWS